MDLEFYQMLKYYTAIYNTLDFATLESYRAGDHFYHRVNSRITTFMLQSNQCGMCSVPVCDWPDYISLQQKLSQVPPAAAVRLAAFK